MRFSSGKRLMKVMADAPESSDEAASWSRCVSRRNGFASLVARCLRALGRLLYSLDTIGEC